jgi:nucleoside-diphosphate-sugar epimerase
MLGESLCLTHPSANVRVARLSNVYGPGQSEHTFLASVIQELQESNRALIHESPDSCKDYVAVNDVLPLLQAIATHGKRRIYNVASGHLTTHAVLAKKLADLTGAEVVFSLGAPSRVFPPVDIEAAATEFLYSPSMLLDQLGVLLSNLRNQFQHGDSL